MSLSDLASIGSFVSGVGVLISLLYLSWQIQQNTRHTRALIQQGRVDRAVELTWRWIEKDWGDGFHACAAGKTDVPENDLWRYLMASRSMFISYEDTFVQYNLGLLEPGAFDDAMAMIRNSMRSRGARVAWEVIRVQFARPYQDYIDRIIAEIKPFDTTDNDTIRWRAAAERLQLTRHAPTAS